MSLDNKGIDKFKHKGCSDSIIYEIFTNIYREGVETDKKATYLPLVYVDFQIWTSIKRKWILRDWIKDIQVDCFWRSLTCKRYQQYFDCMKASVKNNIT